METNINSGLNPNCQAKNACPKLWQSILAAFLGISVGIGLFCSTCKKEALLIEQIPHQLAVVKKAPLEEQGPGFPSLDLVPKLTEKLNILVMGVDSNGRDTDRFLGTRSDTMMLVSIDPVQAKVGVVSIPRDSRVHIPEHGTDKINSAHAYGGPQLAIQTIRESFGVPIDHYIVVDTQGLKQLFEILGPVEVLVEKEMHYVDHTAKLNVNLMPGLQTLTPSQAEEYVRFRHDAKGDIGRIERQQWFIRQVAKKFREPQIVLKLPQLVCLGYECVRTDMSIQDLLSIASFAKDFPHEHVITAMLPGEPQMIAGGSYWLPDPLASQAAFSRVLGCSIASVSNEGNNFSNKETEEVPQPEEISLVEDYSQPTAPGLKYDYEKPLTVSIKYPKEQEKLAEEISEQLSQAGIKVKYRYPIPISECQHELLVQHSVKATESETSKIFEKIPEIEHFPLSVAIESHPTSDLELIISPSTYISSINKNLEQSAEAATNKNSSAYTTTTTNLSIDTNNTLPNSLNKPIH